MYFQHNKINKDGNMYVSKVKEVDYKNIGGMSQIGSEQKNFIEKKYVFDGSRGIEPLKLKTSL